MKCQILFSREKISAILWSADFSQSVYRLKKNLRLSSLSANNARETITV